MPVLYAVRRLFLHFREHIANNLGGVVWRAFRGGDVDGDIREVGPGKGVVEVVFQEVVLREVVDVGGLDGGNVGGAEEADVHCAMRRWLLTGIETIKNNNRVKEELNGLNKCIMSCLVL